MTRGGLTEPELLEKLVSVLMDREGASCASVMQGSEDVFDNRQSILAGRKLGLRL